jgi:hypothetical protein
MLSNVELRVLYEQSLLMLVAIESLYLYFLDYHLLFGCLRLLQLAVLVIHAQHTTLRTALVSVFAVDVVIMLSHMFDRSAAPLFLHFVESPRAAPHAALLLGDAFLCALHALVFIKPSLHLS